jgi:hypothetical protein
MQCGETQSVCRIEWWSQSGRRCESHYLIPDPIWRQPPRAPATPLTNTVTSLADNGNEAHARHAHNNGKTACLCVSSIRFSLSRA